MPAGKIGTKLNLGYEGAYSRTPDAIIMSRLVSMAMAQDQVLFGRALILTDEGTYQVLDSATDVDKFVGISVREVRQATNFYDQSEAGYQKGEYCPALERGNLVVKCRNGVPAIHGKVYVRVDAEGVIPGTVIGGFEAQADGANSVVIPNAKWVNPGVDGNGMAEVCLVERPLP